MSLKYLSFTSSSEPADYENKDLEIKGFLVVLKQWQRSSLEAAIGHDQKKVRQGQRLNSNKSRNPVVNG